MVDILFNMYGKFPSLPQQVSLTCYCVISAMASLLSPIARADFRDDVGFIKLKSEYGLGLPNGTGVRLLQVEYMKNGFWAPQMAGDLADKTFTYVSSTFGGYSEHANEVARYLGRTTSSITPGLTGWKVSEAVSFTGRNNLNGGRTLPPAVASWDIENHSWAGNDALWCLNILQKQDYRIERDNIISCVSIDNGITMSQLMSNGYNSIVVGVSSGAHPRNGTILDTLGRAKPDLVGPAGYTSYATPIVASGAALLVSEINRSPALAPARASTVIKALLMAGATKAEFPTWSHSPQRPLDITFGAGEANIYNSYKALVAGQQLASSTTEVKIDGWDYGMTSSSGRRLYFFTVPSGARMSLSAILTWNRHITPSADWQTLTPRLQNLDLTLWRTSSFSVGSVVSTSASTIDNVEHIYETSLLPGQYALEVVGAVEGEKYGMAWKSALTYDSPVVPPPTPTPSGDPSTLGHGVISDSSFESVRVGVNANGAFLYRPLIAGWTFAADAGIAGNKSGFTSSNPNAPDGTQVAFLQRAGSATVGVSLLAGTYKVSAKIANRANWGGTQTVIVYVNDLEVGRFVAGFAYVSASTTSFTVAEGIHTIRFAGQAATDATLLMDQVSVVPQVVN